MDHKPLITYAGEIQVFQSVIPSLQKGIGAEAVEWKRAYGRTTKHVHLHPRFIPFNPDIMSIGNPDQSVTEQPVLTSLLDQPMLHTYWTDCSDVEVYRSTTKDAIQSWLNSVKCCNVKEWLIILVETPDNKKTNKLLPRTSVLDKIKNDFAQKQTERCVCLSDPHKLDSKSAESLHSMLHRIRQLLLASYSKTLTKFEENMRAQREKRNETGWNFCHYFLLQEELAFVLEMLEVFDEALVQYDELDALFTQFVLNSHLTDTPQWLLSFQRYGDRWPALNLSTASVQILSKIRETIRNSTVSLLNFRNYLFARQAALLVKQKRVNELAQRSLGFLHNCINELTILDVTFSEDGSISCWVFVSCLEILSTICGHGQGSPQNPQKDPGFAINSNSNNSVLNANKKNAAGDHKGHGHQNQHPSSMLASDFSVHTASLWDYAREKLYDLGQLGGLLPKSQPKSDHLHKVISLAAGLTSFDSSELALANGDSNSSTVGNHTSKHSEEPHGETPIEKLKNALSSKDLFEQHYLELCELAMGTYKHIGRIRSARKVGLSLATYYMEAAEYTKAVGFLTDALKTFRDDKWNLLVVDVLLKLSECYQAVNDNDRYIRTCAQIACCKCLNEEKRNYYFDEMMTSLTQLENNDRFIISPSEDTFSIDTMKIETPGKINLNSCDLQVTVSLTSKLPRPVLSNSIQLAILPCDHDHDKHMMQLNQNFSSPFASGVQNNTGVNLNVSGGSAGNNSNKNKLNQPKQGNNKKLQKGDQSSPSVNNSSGEKEKVVRKESVNLNPLTCEDEDINLALSEINVAVMRLDISQHLDTKQDRTVHGGRLLCHNTHQALRRKDSHVKGDVQVSKTDFSQAAKSTDIIINPGANTIVLQAKVSTPGAYRLGQLSIGVKQFELLSPRMGCRYKFTVDKIPGKIEIGWSGEANLNLLAGIEQLISLVLHSGSNHITQGMTINVRSSMGLQLKSNGESSFCSEVLLPLPITAPFNMATVPLIVKAELGPQKDNSVIEHKLMTRCPWTNEETRIPITFVPPFMSSHKLNSVGQRKFVHIVLQGLSDAAFSVCDHQLVVQHQNSQDIPLVPLNPRSQKLALINGRNASYMWEVGVLDFDDETPLRLEFSLSFSNADHRSEIYKYYICLQRFKTLFEIKSRIEPHKGSEFCKAGNMCSMIIEISKFGPLTQSLMYEVRADQHMWAICGRSSGVVSMDGCEVQQVSLDVMPMSPGFLPLPTVHLSKYIPAEQKSSNSSVPKLEPFSPGQVFNRSKGCQIHVLPPPQPPGSNSGIGGSGSGNISNTIIPQASDTHF